MRCWVKSRNERNPHPLLLTGNAENSEETAGDKPEEGGDDVKSAWPLRSGLHTCYNGGYSRKQQGDLEQILKSHLSSDCILQLGYMKLESLVIAGQPYCGECVPEPCTHRPSSHESWGYPKSPQAPTVKPVIGTKS